MTLHSRRSFETFVLGLKAVTLVEQWGGSVAKVGGKVFAMYGLESHGISFKVTEMSFDLLTTLEGIGQAAYSAKRQWVNVEKGAEIADKDLKAYIRAAHRIIASKLTRKLQAELGLSDLVASR